MRPTARKLMKLGSEEKLPVVRKAGPEDAAEIARIYNLYVDAGGVTFDVQRWSESETRQRLSQPEPTLFLLAEADPGVIGWAAVRKFSERFGYRFTCESAIYLDPVVLGQGVADALQLALEEHCRRSGIHHLVARIVSDNSRSIAFHCRYGYELVGIQREVGHVDGRWVDVTIMQKVF